MGIVKRHIDLLLLTVIFIGVLLPARAQRETKLHIIIIDQAKKKLEEISSVQSKTYQTDYQITQALKSMVLQLNDRGYLSASIDTIKGDTLEKQAFLYLGRAFSLTKLDVSSVDENILSRTGFRDKLYLNKPLKPKVISRFFNDALTYLENNGYPFATIKLDSITISGSEVQAVVTMNKNKIIHVDSIQIISENVRLSKHYIQNVINIKQGEVYNEETIKNISSRINDNSFMKEIKPFEVLFSEKSTRLIIVIEKKKANNFDGIIGIQPQNNSGGIVLTGDVKLGLGNMVGLGEKLNLRWQRLRDKTQQIDASLEVPFLFRTPIGISYQLEIYRRDTSYNNVQHFLKIPYYLSNGSFFHVYIKWFKSSLISVQDYKSDTNLPPVADSKSITYGAGYSLNKLDYRLNPSKGWKLEVSAGAGTNEILKNAGLENVNYDSLELKSTRLEGLLDARYFINLRGRNTILIRGNIGAMYSANLVQNQLYRLGGLLTLRGFDEQSIFASSYAIGTAEYRFLFDKDSYISAFFDYAWYELSTINEYQNDMPFGFGLGISFSTKAGIFSLNYALGSQQGNPIDFRTGKIHFGFVNYF